VKQERIMPRSLHEASEKNVWGQLTDQMPSDKQVLKH